MPRNKNIDWKNYDGPDQVMSSHELEMKLKETQPSILNLRSRIPSLDRAIDGFRDGELIVISGPTKNGKTLFAQTLTVNFCRQQEYPLWFSFELPPKQFLSQFSPLPLFYVPEKLKAHVFDWVEDKVQEGFAKFRTRVIFIDHLHYLFDMARTKNPSIEIGTVIRRLKNIAVVNNFVIFLLCHTIKGKNEDNLSYESIRDSSFISQESDCVLMIKRTPKTRENAAQLSIEFHRRTGVMGKMVDLWKINSLLQEIANEEKK